MNPSQSYSHNHVPIIMYPIYQMCGITILPSVYVWLLCRGVIAVVVIFLLIGIIHMPDGPFIRPHPVLWRLVLCISILYILMLIYILFQVYMLLYECVCLCVCVCVCVCVRAYACRVWNSYWNIGWHTVRTWYGHMGNYLDIV